jgi:hypothetical protein
MNNIWNEYQKANEFLNKINKILTHFKYKKLCIQNFQYKYTTPENYLNQLAQIESYLERIIKLRLNWGLRMQKINK